MKTKKLLVFGLIFLSCLKVITQELDPTPLSPQFEAFQRYGDFNVNLSTGVPKITIPLFNLEHDGYKLPVSLDYYPSPLRPGYNYDVCGYGWNHSLRSHISRKINYLPDELADFEAEFPVTNVYRDYNCFEEQNFAPDIFNATLPDGSSFEFTIEKKYSIEDQAVVTKARIPSGRPVKISWRDGYPIYWIKITDEQGIIYTFSDYNINSATTAEDYTEWHLSKIELPWSTEPITFIYNNKLRDEHSAIEVGFGIMGEFKYDGSCFINGWDLGKTYVSETPYLTTDYEYNMMLLTEVSFGSGSILFKYDNDYSGTISGNCFNYLNTIELWNSSEKIKVIEFEKIKLDYYYNNILQLAQLTKLSFKDPSGSSTVSEYNFEYGDLTLNFHTSATDHWGYLTDPIWGCGTNFVFYWPYMPYYLPPILTKLVDGNLNTAAKYQLNALNPHAGRPGGDHGLLNKIVYPTKGYTEFEFERHKFLTSSGYDGVYITDPKQREVAEASGFRIKKISNYDADNNLLRIKSYVYGPRSCEIWDPSIINDNTLVDEYMLGSEPDEHTNVGEVVVDPNLFTFLQFNIITPLDDFRQFLLDGDLVAENIVPSFECGIEGDFELRINSKNFRNLLDGRPQVLYPYVTEYEGNYDPSNPSSTEGINGKTEYVFDLLQDHDGTNEYLNSVLLQSNPRTDGKVFIEPVLKGEGRLLFYEFQSFRYNNLLEKRDYAVRNGNYEKVREETNIWTYSSGGERFRYPYVPFYPRTAVERYLNDATPRFSVTARIHMVPQVFYDNFQISYRTITDYDDSGNSIQNVESYEYEPGGRVSNKTLNNSDGKTSVTKILYPTDYDEPCGTLFIDEMQTANIINKPIEEYTSFDGKVTNGSITEYKTGSNKGLPAIIHNLETIVPLTTFTPSNYQSGSSSNLFVLSSLYKPAIYYDNFNSRGNLLQFHKINDMNVSYFWGYNNTYPVVKATNVSSSVLESVTTAKYAEVGYDNITEPSKNATHEALIRDFHNHLKTQLPNAQIYTYTYKPLVGITSETDPNGIITFYEYDSSGRLEYIKDNDGDIIKKYTYKYKN